MSVNRTGGVTSMLSSGELQMTDLKPVFQVMDIQSQTPAAGGGGEITEMYRVLLSDGSFQQQGLLATQLTELVRSQQLQKGSIVQLTEFVFDNNLECNTIIITELNVILAKYDIIGDPKPCFDDVTRTGTISQIKDEKLGTFGKADWITVNGTIWFIKSIKKFVNDYDESDYEYILQLQIQDHTGVTYVIASEEICEEIIGVSAKELYFLKNEELDEDKFTETVRGVLFNEYKFKLKVKEEFWVDEYRVMLTAVKVEKMKFSSETKALFQEIKLVPN